MSDEQNTPCVICAKKIPKAARKCTECDSYQNWLARFLGGINMGALVTLVPVVTLAWAFINDRLQVHGSNLLATIMECDHGGIRVFATNQGDRGAIVRNAVYRISGGSRTGSVYPLELAGHDSDVLFVDGGKQHLLFLQPSPVGAAAVPLVPGNIHNSGCVVHLNIDVIDFDQRTGTRELSCPCPH